MKFIFILLLIACGHPKKSDEPFEFASEKFDSLQVEELKRADSMKMW